MFVWVYALLFFFISCFASVLYSFFFFFFAVGLALQLIPLYTCLDSMLQPSLLLLLLLFC